ncbi:hypothetical protein ACLB2K_071097 [Fragaria x ananassa]
MSQIHSSQTSSSSPSIQSTANIEETASLHRNISPLGPPPEPPHPASALGSEPTPPLEYGPETSSQPSFGKKRKEPANKSPLWSFFTRCKISNSDEIDPEWCTCNICGQEVLCSVKRNGTSSMWAHVRKCELHPMRTKPGETDPKQSKLNLDNVSGGKPHKYNRQRCDDKCIEMIIRDELPFRHVEKEGFKAFVKELQPEWPMMTRKQVAKGVMSLSLTHVVYCSCSYSTVILHSLRSGGTFFILLANLKITVYIKKSKTRNVQDPFNTRLKYRLGGTGIGYPLINDWSMSLF